MDCVYKHVYKKMVVWNELPTCVRASLNTIRVLRNDIEWTSLSNIATKTFAMTNSNTRHQEWSWINDEIMTAIDAGDVCSLVLFDLSAASWYCRPWQPTTCSQLPCWSHWSSSQLVFVILEPTIRDVQRQRTSSTAVYLKVRCSGRWSLSVTLKSQ